MFGIPAWTAILLWYHLQIVADTSLQTEKFTAPEAEKAAPLPQEESIDRITVKDGSRIHIIKVEDLLYIQVCGDYATLVTPDGEYIKEQTMKYFETHLPADNFVRIHRSSIVNVTQISRVEQYGKRDLPSDVEKWRQTTGKPLRIPVTEGAVGHINSESSPSGYFRKRKNNIGLTFWNFLSIFSHLLVPFSSIYFSYLCAIIKKIRGLYFDCYFII